MLLLLSDIFLRSPIQLLTLPDRVKLQLSTFVYKAVRCCQCTLTLEVERSCMINKSAQKPMFLDSLLLETFRCTFTANRKLRFEICGLALEVVIVRAFRFK